jgi:OOP family OmpA-OmpF porin
MHKTLVCVVVAAGMMQGCSTLSENKSTSQPVTGFVSDANDSRVMTATGDCLHVNAWSTDSMVVECNASAKPEVEAPAPEPMKKMVSLSFDGTALFDFDSADLSAAGRSELDGLIAKVKGNSDIGAIKVVGHTDSLGPAEYNQSLSERRAASVQSYLQTSLSTVDIMSSGMGELEPVADNSTETGRQRNRRVEVQIDAKMEKAIFN